MVFIPPADRHYCLDPWCENPDRISSLPRAATSLPRASSKNASRSTSRPRRTAMKGGDQSSVRTPNFQREGTTARAWCPVALNLERVSSKFELATAAWSSPPWPWCRYRAVPFLPPAISLCLQVHPGLGPLVPGRPATSGGCPQGCGRRTGCPASARCPR